MAAYRHSTLRTLAPLSLLLFAVVLAIVIATSVGGDSGSVDERDAGRAEQRRSARADGEPGGRLAGAGDKRVYVVKSGDNLSTISDKTGVPVPQLQQLNPELDPRQLIAGQRVKLRR